jgi:APA family basic amino acid/polyamine antiporter
VSIGVLVLIRAGPSAAFKVPFGGRGPSQHSGLPFIMVGLPKQAWERFFIWLALGVLIYVFYGYWHSRLRRSIHSSL